jgi:hypothetical protein
LRQPKARSRSKYSARVRSRGEMSDCWHDVRVLFKLVVNSHGVEQAFRPAVKDEKRTALAAEVNLTIPYRGTTSDSTYFITANILEKKSLFQVEKIAHLFLEILFSYRKEGKYHLHEFLVMPDHFHLLISPMGITLDGRRLDKAQG